MKSKFMESIRFYIIEPSLFIQSSFRHFHLLDERITEASLTQNDSHGVARPHTIVSLTLHGMLSALYYIYRTKSIDLQTAVTSLWIF